MNVTLYSKDNCSKCVRAKQILINRQIPFTELKLNEDFTRDTLLGMFPDARSFPVVVVDGFNIGDENNLNHYLIEESKNTTKLLNE
jgi:glutaredoxin